MPSYQVDSSERKHNMPSNTNMSKTESLLINNRYQKLRLISKGGMGTVYLVLDKRLNKTWALKEIPLNGFSLKDREIIKNGILMETEFLSRLEHPCIPRIIDIIESEQNIRIVMEYIEGQSLGDVLYHDGAQSEENVIKWAIQLCDVLGYLHSQHPPIIYRDMKPHNIILRPDGNIALIDFGTAREFRQGDKCDTVLLGTMGYAAPEQFGGSGQTDQRTDIFGLGATMFSLITGCDPTRMQNSNYLISLIRPEMKGSVLENIIAKCCQQDRGLRYQNCIELKKDLYAYQKLNNSAINVAIKKAEGLFNRLTKRIANPSHTIKNKLVKKDLNRIDGMYQVFISYKQTDDYGHETQDSRMAVALHKSLEAKGVVTFCGDRSIVNEAEDKYKNAISNALAECSILVVVGTRPDYMTSPWIQREYREFLSKIKNANHPQKYAIFTYLGPEMHVNSLPEDLKDYTVFTDPNKLRNVIINRLKGVGKHPEMPKEFKANAVWEHVHAGFELKKRYRLNKCIKEGTYYKLFEAEDLNVEHSTRLIKIINNYQMVTGTRDPEIECLTVISDIPRGVPSIFDFGKEEDYTYLVTNYAHGTRLDYLIKNGALNEHEVIQWMLDICETLHHLHTHEPRVIHCNIKPSNIFIDSGKAELINFSAAYIEGHNTYYIGIVGSSQYQAPELRQRFIPYSNETVMLSDTVPKPSVDIYSLGATMSEALLENNKSKTFTKTKMGISHGIRYILQKCTHEDPSVRYQSVLELKNDLERINLIGVKAVLESLHNNTKHILGANKKHNIPLQPRITSDLSAKKFWENTADYNGEDYGHTEILRTYASESDMDDTLFL